MTGVSYEAVVVGAGPAGLGAASELARHGAATVLVDEQAWPGGQIYRAAEGCGDTEEALFGRSYLRGGGLIAELRRQPVDYRSETTVVNVADDLSVDVVRRDGMERIGAKALIMATGAYERPLAVPGWTLPGVMTAGAGQILAKQARLVPDGRAVLAGRGPLIWLLAWQYARMGVQLTAIVSIGGGADYLRAARHAPAFLGSHYARDGLAYLTAAWRTTEVVRARSIPRIEGDDRVTGITIRTAQGAHRTIAADTVLLHNGVLPDVNLASGLGCELVWNPARAAWEPVTDAWQASSREGIYFAGDGSGIEGARAAECSGRLAAAGALVRLGKVAPAERDRLAAPWMAERRGHLRGRAFIDALYPPIGSIGDAPPDTLVCRCESVTRETADAVLGEARQAEARATGLLNHLKAMTRCGMGPCQGRMCGPTIAALLAGRHGLDPPWAGPPSQRFPNRPLRLETLAGFEVPDAGAASHDDVRE